jgi:hypothetical protein
VKPTPAPAPPIRQDRNAKTNALDQVSKWLTDEDGIGKRKNPDDSDYSDEEDISELDVSSPKKAKLDLSSSSSVVSEKGRRNSQTSGSKVNGTAQKKVDENSAEVVLTKGTKSTGVVRKPGPASSSPAAQAASPINSQKNEAQVRIVQKGEESVPTGVVRIIPSIICSLQTASITSPIMQKKKMTHYRIQPATTSIIQRSSTTTAAMYQSKNLQHLTSSDGGKNETKMQQHNQQVYLPTSVKFLDEQQKNTVKPPVRNIGPTTKQLQIQQLQMTSSLPGMMSFILF